MSSLPIVIAVTAVAAGIGATVRFLVSRQLNGDLPIGTLIINLAASFALGVIVSLDDPWPTIAGIGALGALSTWSAAANEAAALSREDRGAMALAYLGLTCSSGILMAWFGLQVGQLI